MLVILLLMIIFAMAETKIGQGYEKDGMGIKHTKMVAFSHEEVLL